VSECANGRRVSWRKKAKAAGAVGSHSLKDWNRLVARYGGRCAYCGADGGWTRDHVIPVTRGGSDFIGNILPACMSCNASKQDKFPTEWKVWQRRRAA
jgi:5-methylcytosine-specific restriction endonuclease McrA